MFDNRISDNDRLILLSARLNPSPCIHEQIKQAALSSQINWDKVILTSKKQEVLPLVYYTLNRLNIKDKIPQENFEAMKNYYYMNLKRNLFFEKEVSSILESANKNDATIIPLKGFSLIYSLYPVPGLRIMADIDILIKIDDYIKIKDALIELGYKEAGLKYHERAVDEYRHMGIFSKKIASDLNIFIELHGILAYPRPHVIKIPDLWQRAHEKIINGERALFLSEEDMFISLALHLRSHTRRLNLKFIVDIAELLNRYGHGFDWGYIKKIALKNHIVTTVYLFLYLARELLEADCPAKIQNDFQPNIIKRALIHLTINKYNFLALKKWQGFFSRFLIFDNMLDFILYLWRVSFLERAIIKKMPRELREIMKK